MIFEIILLLFSCFESIASSKVPPPTCPNGFSVLNDYTCVKFFDTPLLYQDALNSCRTFTGGHLVSLHNAIDNRVLINMVTSQGYTHPVWLGLTCPVDSWGLCRWEDLSGYTSDYNSFANGSPLTDAGNNIYTLVTGNSAGKWVSADGTILSLAYFCEVPTNNAPEFCPSELDGFCYFLNMDLLDESDARDYCRTQSGDLASVHSKKESDHIHDLFPRTSGLYQYRVGGRLNGTENNWLDGSSFDYCNYGYFNPDMGECLTGSVYNHIVNVSQWISNPCEQKLPFVCKWAKPALKPKMITQNGDQAMTSSCDPTPTPTSHPNFPEMCYRAQIYTGNGTIYSPYYPGSYNQVKSISCTYVITVPAGSIAQIKFSPDSFIDRSNIDFYAYIEDGTKFFSFSGVPPTFPINSTTNVIKMIFNTNYEKNYDGMQWVAQFGNNF